jgi:hypothetical protein
VPTEDECFVPDEERASAAVLTNVMHRACLVALLAFLEWLNDHVEGDEGYEDYFACCPVRFSSHGQQVGR